MSMRAIIMGFGGTGAHILTYLKELAVLKHGHKPDSVRFLLFDTLSDWSPGDSVPTHGGAAEEKLAKGREELNSLNPGAGEYFYLKDDSPDLEEYISRHLSSAGRPENFPHLRHWLHAPWLRKNTAPAQRNIAEGAAKQRQIGRFAMFQNAGGIKQHLITALTDLSRGSTTQPVNVWIVASAAGGTGAGCLFDAALLTRMAADQAASPIKILLNGAVLLPEVYSDIQLVNRARGYSLFREAERLQASFFDDADYWTEPRFDGQSDNVANKVLYSPNPAERGMSALVRDQLFDNLFYLGEPCNSAAERDRFFTSVANAIDPYLDESSGDQLRQAAINHNGAASALWASRVYLPMETLKEIFAWEEIAGFTRKASAGYLNDLGNSSYHYGSAEDRKNRAREKALGLLALFENLYDFSSKTEKERASLATRLTPRDIVDNWYHMGVASAVGQALSPPEMDAIRLCYINPFLSLTRADGAALSPEQIRIKTYQENRKAKGVKESQEESRKRFGRELEEVSREYLAAQAGESPSLAKGCGFLMDKVRRRLFESVDQIILDAFSREPFCDPENSNRQGTVLTRLLEELENIVHADGVLARVNDTVSTLLNEINAQGSWREDQLSQTQSDLKLARPKKLRTWVDSLQKRARDEYGDYVQWQQKLRLLKEMQGLVNQVASRFEKWRKALRGMENALALDAKGSLLNQAENGQLTSLKSRLGRLAANRSAVMCFDDAKESTRLHGYRKTLAQKATKGPGGRSLAFDILQSAEWQVAAGDSPGVKLSLELEGRKVSYTPEQIVNGTLAGDLRGFMRGEIDARLANLDIFDYLLYLKEKGVDESRICSELAKASRPLLRTSGTQAECRFVYHDPAVSEKRALMQSLTGHMAKISKHAVFQNTPIDTHTDRHSLTLLSLVKPNLNQISNITECRDRYLALQVQELSGDDNSDSALRDAQVYHPFRAELEAWHIERNWSRKTGKALNPDVDHIPSRVTRLLDEPEMMRAFVRCVAVRAVEGHYGKDWIWHTADGRDVVLVQAQSNPSGDLLRAAVVFVLQKREGKKEGLTRIGLEDAEQSVISSAKQIGNELPQLLADFRNNGLDTFIRESFRPSEYDQSNRELKALRRIFHFYLDPDIGTDLSHRLNLR